MKFRTVLFDWRGTLVRQQSKPEWVADALARLSRESEFDDVLIRVHEADGAVGRLDTHHLGADRALHHTRFMQIMTEASIDQELADSLYASESDHRRNKWAIDVAPTFARLHRAGIRIGVVSDIHFDIRPSFAEAQLIEMVHSFSLACEVGRQKPSREIYEHALDGVGVSAPEALMVGDRAQPDGGAVSHGLHVLLVPPLQHVEQARLARVLDLALDHD